MTGEGGPAGAAPMAMLLPLSIGRSIMLNRCGALAAICILCGAWGDGDDGDDRGKQCEWTQWGQSPAHDGSVCVDGQSGLRMLARLVVDKFSAQETAEARGQLLIHYP